MKNRALLNKSIVVLALLLSCVSGDGATSHPNIIFILVDDVGYGDLSAHGNPVLKTPELDRLSEESVRLTDFHVSPMCTPTRGSILTGLDPIRNRALFVCRGRSILSPKIPTLAEVLRSSGYDTGLFGKWHLGAARPHTPADRGFDETLWFRSSHIGGTADFYNNDYFDPFLVHNGVQTRYDGYITDILFDETFKWIREQKNPERPFFAFLALNAAHGPYWGDSDYRKPYADLKEGEARFFGMIAQIDENMGRLMHFLDEEGLSENTLLVFTSDNGTAMGEQIFNAGMRGKKRSLYDGGHRVPCFVRWPDGGVGGGRNVLELTRGMDFFPTLVEIAGGTEPNRVDGKNLLKLLQGKKDFSFANRFSVVQMGNLYEEHAGAVKWDAALMRNPWRMVGSSELYDLKNDPGQTNNVIERFPKVVDQMKALYEQWWAEVPADHRDYVANVIGADDRIVALSAPDWQLGYCDHPAGHRGGLNVNGKWRLKVVRSGVYNVQLYRWPEEAKIAIPAGLPMFIARDGTFEEGRALPIVSGSIQMGDYFENISVGKHQAALSFTVELAAGLTDLQGTFYDESGEQLCGSYYASVRYLGELEKMRE